jgi:hypothetical protein
MAFATKTKVAQLSPESEKALVEALRKMRGVDITEIVESMRRAMIKALPDTSKSPLADALLRGIEAQRRLKESEGGHVSAQEAAALLGLASRQAVLDRHRQQHLIGWREKHAAVRFPVWQFRPEGGVLNGLPDVLEILDQAPIHDDWDKVLFFLNPRESLKNERPIDLLRQGQVERVKELAQAYVE